MKNTMGYGLNSFLDHTRPVDILAHLVVGSEGTLAFIAEIVMRTVPLLRHARTALLVFDDLSAATGALPALVGTGPATIELLDATSLRVGQTDPQADALLRGLSVERAGGTARRVPGRDGRRRRRARHRGRRRARGPPGHRAAHARRRPRRPGRAVAHPQGPLRRGRGRAAVRHDGAAGGHRRAGARAAAAPASGSPRCSTGTATRDGVIFGHAKDGNIHFMLTERFARPAIARPLLAGSPRTWWS